MNFSPPISIITRTRELQIFKRTFILFENSNPINPRSAAFQMGESWTHGHASTVATRCSDKTLVAAPQVDLWKLVCERRLIYLGSFLLFREQMSPSSKITKKKRKEKKEKEKTYWRRAPNVVHEIDVGRHFGFSFTTALAVFISKLRRPPSSDRTANQQGI